MRREFPVIVLYKSCEALLDFYPNPHSKNACRQHLRECNDAQCSKSARGKRLLTESRLQMPISSSLLYLFNKPFLQSYFYIKYAALCLF